MRIDGLPSVIDDGPSTLVGPSTAGSTSGLPAFTPHDSIMSSSDLWDQPEPRDPPTLLATHGSMYTLNPAPGRPSPTFEDEMGMPQSPSPGSAPLLPLTSIASELVPDRADVPTRPATPEPLPVFHVDDLLLSQLREQLIERTGALNVEQLEQLRAMSLDKVWRARMEWDRDDLVKDMQGLLDTFLAEVAGEEEEL